MNSSLQDFHSHKRSGSISARFAIGIALLFLTIGYYYNTTPQWISVTEYDFSKQENAADEIAFLDAFLKETPPLPVENGALKISSENLSTFCWLKSARVRGDVKLVVEMSYDGKVDGFEMGINSKLQNTASSNGANPMGYSLQLGGYLGAIDFISRNETVHRASFSSSTQSKARPNQHHRVVFQRVGNHITMEVNGTQVRSLEDPLPFDGSHYSYLYLHSYAPVSIHKIQVYRNAPPKKVSPLVAGDVFWDLENYPQAIKNYEDLAIEYANSEVGEQALGKALLVQSQYLPHETRRTQSLYKRLESDYPHSPILKKYVELEALSHWKAERYPQAIQMLLEILSSNPESQLAGRFLDFPRHNFPADQCASLFSALSKNPTLGAVDLGQLKADSLEQLRDNRFGVLLANHNRIKTLAGIERMPLRVLTVSNNQITSLDPVRNLSLAVFDGSRNQIQNIAPLDNKSFEFLDLRDNQITAIESLKTVTASNLNIDGNPISSLEPLRDKTFESLSFSRTSVSSLEPLRNSPISDRIYLNFCPITDLSPLQGKKFHSFSARGNKLREISALKGRPFRKVDIAQNEIQSLAALEGTPIKELHCFQNKIQSLAPLEKSKIKKLLCSGNPLQSLEPFLLKPPQYFQFFSEELPLPEIQKAIQAWEGRADCAHHLLQAKTLLAWKTKDIQALKSLAIELNEHRYLLIPDMVSGTKAEELARSVGGHSVSLQSKEENDIALSLTKNCITDVWIGLKCENGKPTGWTTDEPITYNNVYPGPPEYYGREFYIISPAGNWSPSGGKQDLKPFIIEWEKP